MNLAYKSELYRQVESSSAGPGVAEALEKIIDNINNSVYEIDNIIEYVFDKYHLWKFISVKMLMKGLS